MTTSSSTMKTFRERTGATVPAALRELRKRQAVETAKILQVLKAGPRTAPEIARETGFPSDLVVWYVMTFCKAKTLRVADKTSDGFYRYALPETGGP